jgi:hypothetical protein
MSALVLTRRSSALPRTGRPLPCTASAFALAEEEVKRAIIMPAPCFRDEGGREHTASIRKVGGVAAGLSDRKIEHAGSFTKMAPKLLLTLVEFTPAPTNITFWRSSQRSVVRGAGIRGVEIRLVFRTANSESLIDGHCDGPQRRAGDGNYLLCGSCEAAIASLAASRTAHHHSPRDPARTRLQP